MKIQENLILFRIKLQLKLYNYILLPELVLLIFKGKNSMKQSLISYSNLIAKIVLATTICIGGSAIAAAPSRIILNGQGSDPAQLDLSGKWGATFKTGSQNWTSVDEYYRAKSPHNPHDLQIMALALVARINFRRDLKAALLNTGYDEIVADTPFIANASTDPFWGWAGGRGQNMLGQLLMQIRTELRAIGSQCPPALDVIAQRVAAAISRVVPAHQDDADLQEAIRLSLLNQAPGKAADSDTSAAHQASPQQIHYDDSSLLPTECWSPAGYCLSIKTNPLSPSAPQTGTRHMARLNLPITVDQAVKDATREISQFLNSCLGQREGITGEGINIDWQAPHRILDYSGIAHDPDPRHDRTPHMTLADAGCISLSQVDRMRRALISQDAAINACTPCDASFDIIQVFITRDKPFGALKQEKPGFDQIVFGLGIQSTNRLDRLAEIYRNALSDSKPFEPHASIVLLRNVPHAITIKLMNALINSFIANAHDWYTQVPFQCSKNQCQFS